MLTYIPRANIINNYANLGCVMRSLQMTTIPSRLFYFSWRRIEVKRDQHK